MSSDSLLCPDRSKRNQFMGAGGPGGNGKEGTDAQRGDGTKARLGVRRKEFQIQTETGGKEVM